MIDINGIEYRNLVEQVAKNKTDIAALLAGIKIVGSVSDAGDIPADLNPGECYLVGDPGDYDLYMKLSGGAVVNLGDYPARGPQGIQGLQGDAAEIGNVNSSAETIDSALSASVEVNKDGNNIDFRFYIPKGAKGNIGEQGPQGPQGIQGPEGPQGPQGAQAVAMKILYTVNTSGDLPLPTTLEDPLGSAILVGTEPPYALYVVTMTSDNDSTLIWKNLGPLEPNQVTVDDHLDANSHNPVENAIVTEALNDKLTKGTYSGNTGVGYADVASNLSPYSESSGDVQDEPFIIEGTGTGNGLESVDTGSLAYLQEKKGNALVVNFLADVQVPNPGTRWSITRVNEYQAIVNYTSGESISDWYPFNPNHNGVPYKSYLVTGHKYLVWWGAILPNGFLSIRSGERISDGVTGYTTKSMNGIKGYVFTHQYKSNTGHVSGFRGQGDASSFSDLLLTFVFCDLTKFGFSDEVIDDITANPDNFFRYYQGSLVYNAGELKNSTARYLMSIGRNAYDPDISYNKVIPNRKYHYHGSAGSTISFYDGGHYVIGTQSVNSGDVFTTPPNCIYITSSNETDMTISLAYYKDVAETVLEDGYDENYEYELLSTIDTGSEALKAFDTKDIDGTIHRNTGQVDLATLSWTDVGDGIFTTNDLTSVLQGPASNDEVAELVADLFTPRETSGFNPDADNWTIAASFGGSLAVRTPSSSITPSGKLQYKLQTPAVEQGTEINEIININDFGSLFVDGNGIPFGNKIFYPVDYKAFLDTLFNRASGSADNIVIQSEIDDAALSARGYVKLASISGYDASKTQTLKNVEGVFVWVDD